MTRLYYGPRFRNSGVADRRYSYDRALDKGTWPYPKRPPWEFDGPTLNARWRGSAAARARHRTNRERKLPRMVIEEEVDRRVANTVHDCIAKLENCVEALQELARDRASPSDISTIMLLHAIDKLKKARKGPPGYDTAR